MAPDPKVKQSKSCSVMSDSLRPHGCGAYQAPLSMGFSRQEYWSCHFLLQGIFPSQTLLNACSSMPSAHSELTNGNFMA